MSKRGTKNFPIFGAKKKYDFFVQNVIWKSFCSRLLLPHVRTYLWSNLHHFAHFEIKKSDLKNEIKVLLLSLTFSDKAPSSYLGIMKFGAVKNVFQTFFCLLLIIFISYNTDVVLMIDCKSLLSARDRQFFIMEKSHFSHPLPIWLMLVVLFINSRGR